MYRAQAHLYPTSDRDQQLLPDQVSQAVVDYLEAIYVEKETTVQLAKLRELKCEEGQRYVFSQPLTSQAAPELIAAAPQW